MYLNTELKNKTRRKLKMQLKIKEKFPQLKNNIFVQMQTEVRSWKITDAIIRLSKETDKTYNAK